jgi:hypothetical protein
VPAVIKNIIVFYAGVCVGMIIMGLLQVVSDE